MGFDSDGNAMKRILWLLVACVTLVAAAALYFSVTPDSHLVVLNRDGDTLWIDTLWGAGFDTAYIQAGTFVTLVRSGETTWVYSDTAGMHSWLDSVFLGLHGKADSAVKADTAAYALNGAWPDTSLYADTALTLKGKADSSVVSDSTKAVDDSLLGTVADFTRHRGQAVFGASPVVTGVNAMCGGGLADTASDTFCVVAGGWGNKASNEYAAVGGGRTNKATGDHSTVAGGRSNTASGSYASVIGGSSNTASGAMATVLGGNSTSASGAYAWAGGYVCNAGGPSAAANGYYARSPGLAGMSFGLYDTTGAAAADSADAIIGGYGNYIGGCDFAFIGGGQTDRVTGRYGAVAGGLSDTASGVASFATGIGCNATDSCAKAGGMNARALKWQDVYTNPAGTAMRIENIDSASTQKGVTGIYSTLVAIAKASVTSGTALDVAGAAKFGSLILGDTWLVRNAGGMPLAAFAASTSFSVYNDSVTGVDTIQLSGLNRQGAFVAVYNRGAGAGDTVFVRNGATLLATLTAGQNYKGIYTGPSGGLSWRTW
jgi:hypothetical protein